MTEVDEFVKEFLQHAAEYDPRKAREYYLRNRKLKGRKKAADPRSKVGYNGKPLKPLGKRLEEDETPNVSPTGAKLVDFDGKGLGKATYDDRSVYDALVGWKQGGQAVVAKARAENNSQRAKSGLSPIGASQKKGDASKKNRIEAMEKKFTQAKSLANKAKDPKTKAKLLKRLGDMEKRLRSSKKKLLP